MGSGRGIRAIITKRACARLTLLLVLLGGGAIANVAVAWGISVGVLDSSEDETAARDAVAFNADGAVIEYIEVSRFTAAGTAAYSTSRIRTKGVNSPYVLDAPRADDFRPTWAKPSRILNQLPSEGVGKDTEVVCARGWPALAMRCRVDLHGDRRPKWEVRSAVNLTEPQSGLLVMLPLSPIWPAFAINTVFYAVILWVLFAAPFALRRRRRINRGLCVNCAYDLRGRESIASGCGHVCPECGTAVVGVPAARDVTS